MPTHVSRPRLTTRLGEQPLGIVWAGGGWGKSALAAEYRDGLGIAAVEARLDAGDGAPDRLVGRLRRALWRAGRSDALAAVTEAMADPREAVEVLADALGAAEEPLLLIVDDVHHADAGAAALLGRLAADLPGHHRLLLLGRGAPAGLPEPPDAVVLDSTDLAFTVAEVLGLGAGLDLAPDEAGALLRATGGWAAAVVLAIGRLRRARDRDAELRELTEQPRVLAHLVHGLLASLPEAERASVVQLAHLPLIGEEMASGDLLRRATTAGIPLARVRDGWWELAGGVQELLSGMAPLDPRVAEDAASAYLRAGEVPAAVTVLLRAGLGDAAANLVAELAPDRVDQLDHAELGALVDALPASAVDAHPGVLLHYARACQPAAQVQRRTAALERAQRAAAGAGRLRREIDVERALDLARDDDFEAADALASAVLDAAADDELATRARALDVRARAEALRGDAASLARAEALFEASLVLSRALGQRNWVAQTLLALADRVYFARGQHELAVQRIDDLLADLPGRSRYRAVTLSFRAQILIDCGRFADAEATFAEMRRLSEATGDERAHGYLAWVVAQLASLRGDADATREALLEAESRAGEWFEHSTGAEFLADAADLLDRVGDRNEARRYLERARERSAEAGMWFGVAESAVLARAGDPAAARTAIAATLAQPRLLRRERWRLLLLDAHAAHRCAAPDAGALAARAFEEAATLGTPQLPLVRERAIAESLLPLAVAAGSASAASLASAGPRLAIAVLGGFSVTRGGTPVALPEGRPQALVKLVAASGGATLADVAIEALWPGTAPAAGRRGLRNALHRTGGLVVRAGECLRLADAAEVDAVIFERLAAAATDPTALRRAVDRYPGELLPDDRYAPWAAAPRERLRATYVELLDRLAEAVEAQGELDEALRILDRAIGADPHDERRYLLAARILGAQGRRASATLLLGRGADALRELGLPVPPAFAKLAATL